MVYYFSTQSDSGEEVMLYMGKHKEENEQLIKYGLDTDVWFHVDNQSSAHVYLRLPAEWTWDTIPQNVLMDCAQLTKANSIKGNKLDNVTVIYTPWSNLHKTGAMVDGQVGFHKDKLVRKVFVETRTNAIVNRLNKTKHELFPDLAKQRLDYEKKLQNADTEARRQRQKEELALERQRKQLAYERDHAYEDVFTQENLRHSENQARGQDFEDDFM